MRWSSVLRQGAPVALIHQVVCVFTSFVPYDSELCNEDMTLVCLSSYVDLAYVIALCFLDDNVWKSIDWCIWSCAWALTVASGFVFGMISVSPDTCQTDAFFFWSVRVCSVLGVFYSIMLSRLALVQDKEAARPLLQ